MVARKLSVLLAIVIAASAPIAAQTLTIPGASRAADSQSAYPSRGMTMRQVEKSFGAPVKRRGAIGDPPITRWEYDTFIVYFEYKHVIHSVPKR